MSIQDEIKSAVTAHAAWKAGLHDAIESGNSGLSVNTIGLDDQCDFGKWLHGTSITQAIRDTQEYLAAKEAHAAFHCMAAKVAELALAGNKAEANKLMGMGGEFSKASIKLTQAMMALGKIPGEM